jgi:hypothetical protein
MKAAERTSPRAKAVMTPSGKTKRIGKGHNPPLQPIPSGFLSLKVHAASGFV